MSLRSADFVSWELGQTKGEDEVDFFQRLIDGGTLEGMNSRYQRRAKELADQGLIFFEDEDS